MERGNPALAPFETSNLYCQLLPARAFPWANSGVSPDAAVAAAGAVAVVAACAVAAARASVPFVASVVGAVARLAAFLDHSPVVVPAAGGPVPASAAVSCDPAAVFGTAFPVAAGIACPGFGLPCSATKAAGEPTVRWRGSHDPVARRNFSTVAAGRSVRPLWRAQLRALKKSPAFPWPLSTAARDSRKPGAPDFRAPPPCGASARLPDRCASRGRPPLPPASHAR